MEEADHGAAKRTAVRIFALSMDLSFDLPFLRLRIPPLTLEAAFTNQVACPPHLKGLQGTLVG